MGIEERVLELISAECTRRRMETKWEESFSDASGDSRGAHRLQNEVSLGRGKEWEKKLTICNS